MASDEATSDAWWVVLSSLFLPLVIIVFWYKSHIQRYSLQILLVILSTIFSIFHHTCYEPALKMCGDRPPDGTELLDVMAAFLALTLGVAPFIECWGGGKRARTVYELTMGPITGLCVVLWQDGLEATLVLSLTTGFVFGWVLILEVRRRLTPEGMSKTWWIRFIVACVFITFAGLTYGMNKSTLISFEENRRWHPWWHVTSAAFYITAMTLIPDSAALEALETKYHNVHVSPPPISLEQSSNLRGKYSSARILA